MSDMAEKWEAWEKQAEELSKINGETASLSEIKDYFNHFKRLPYPESATFERIINDAMRLKSYRQEIIDGLSTVTDKQPPNSKELLHWQAGFAAAIDFIEDNY
ncbi:hypothetical protein [Salibacterium halotolerans]|uniref:Uncharacterized protein n=1 Tax=Salibacterium halotolerans TaxID=1884432 RepID=A0A1I5MKJ5_9BACI|nr:hypothetical protein [Salibacterium halotolerans]SFP10112.1 hypothetical protein SAMN05518683_102268 [Salibacterium halotolerans]